MSRAVSADTNWAGSLPRKSIIDNLPYGTSASRRVRDAPATPNNQANAWLPAPATATTAWGGVACIPSTTLRTCSIGSRSGGMLSTPPDFHVSGNLPGFHINRGSN